MKVKNILSIGIHGDYGEKMAQLLASRIRMSFNSTSEIIVARLGLLDEVHKIVSTSTGLPLEKRASVFSYTPELLPNEIINDYKYMGKSIENWITFITESFRHGVRKDYWIQLLLKRMDYIYSVNADVVVITPDVQYENEMQFFKNNGIMISIVDNIKNVQDLILYAESDQRTFVAGVDGTEQLSITADDIFEQYIRTKLNQLWGE